MLLDAHNHLHDRRLDPWRSAIEQELRGARVSGAVVNGTREEDWAAVATLARECSWVIPSLGLHPWHVNERSPAWRETIERLVTEHAGCGIGEIGLDRWIEGADLEAQAEVFRWQLDLAARRNAPATIHCVKAWGALWDILREAPLPERGFLIHAYGGPAEMVKGFAGRGAYFSFSPYFLHERKVAQRELFREIPRDRLLVETDAPDLAPPPERNPRPLAPADGKVMNHPANLDVAYKGLAEVLGWPLAELEEQVAANFERLFGKAAGNR